MIAWLDTEKIETDICATEYEYNWLKSFTNEVDNYFFILPSDSRRRRSISGRSPLVADQEQASQELRLERC